MTNHNVTFAGIENENFVIVGQQPWDTDIGSNCKDIALELSKKNRVLYVNSPLDRITSWRARGQQNVRKRLRVIGRKEDGLVEIGHNLWNLYPDCLVESINWLNHPCLFDFINKRNNKRFSRSIRTALSRLGFDRYYLINDNEVIKCFYLTDYLDPILSLYYSRDYILATPYWKKHGTRLEPLVIKANDACVANSTYLMDYCKQYNPNAYYVGQGCDLTCFNPENTSELPQELSEIQCPIVGYVGALIGNRLDVEIISHIATNKLDWMVVLVGPEDEVFERSELHGLPNVLFVGKKPLTQLAAYIQRFDVCINPQSVNELTIGNYPRKIDEYLAMGKPVVATATRAMEVFSEAVYLAKDKQEYIPLIMKALTEDSPQQAAKRKELAGSHTWESSVNEIYRAIRITEEKRAQAGTQKLIFERNGD